LSAIRFRRPDSNLVVVQLRSIAIKKEARRGSRLGLMYSGLSGRSIHFNDLVSTPGAGSEFIFALPVSRDAEIGDVIPGKGIFSQERKEGISKFENFDSGFYRPQLLIIEDNREMIEYLCRLLGDEYQIITAENGIIGIELSTEHIPDIILSDVMMPGKDGYQVCKELKNDFRTNHIPIILLTARPDTDSRITGMKHGADAYLTKPFFRKELMVCLKNLFHQREILRLKFRNNLFDKKNYEKDSGLNGTFLNRVLRHLEKNYENDRYGINNLYSDMGISRIQLHRKLTALTGQSASNFIRNFRLQKARRLLLETEKNVTDIAYDVGFADANYFSKAFILEYGITATELRKTLR